MGGIPGLVPTENHRLSIFGGAVDTVGRQALTADYRGIENDGRTIGHERQCFLNREENTLHIYVEDRVRESLEMLIQFAGSQPETFASAEEFLAHPRVLTPTCLVLDVSLPDLNGLDLQKLVADRIEMPIIFITGYGDVPMTVRAMKAGAVEFLTKPFAEEALLGAIRHAIERSQTALGNEAEMQALRDRYASLTPREREVMAMGVSGLLNKQVGFELGISEITVKAHRGRMMLKMKADSLADLVRMAERLRIN